MTEVRALLPADDRKSFRSGDHDLDRFFSKYAGQNQFRHHIGTTYVAVDGERILGFATVAPGHLETEALPATLRKSLPAYPLPVLRLGRLAVAETAQSRGIGKHLLRHVFLLALEMSERLGCVGIIVDAKPAAVDYYTRFGFAPIALAEGHLEARPAPQPMFLPLELIAAAAVRK